MTLLQAIGPFGANRIAQLSVARAYWKLAAAQGDYNWSVEEANALDQINIGTAPLDQTEMATARSSTQARLLEAKLGAVTAQQELADLLGMPASSPLPLAADAPLVGAYRTYFETLYAGRIAPPRLRLIDRTLPIRRETIETHVVAVQAAASAVHAADEARSKGQADLQQVLLCRAELSRQRRSFLAAVRDYNLDIGEYALTVAEPNVPIERVIGMLIRVKPAASSSSGGGAVPPPASNTAVPPGASAAAPPGSTSPGLPSAASPGDSPLFQPALPSGASPGSTTPNSATPNSPLPNSPLPSSPLPSSPTPSPPSFTPGASNAAPNSAPNSAAPAGGAATGATGGATIVTPNTPAH